MDKHESALIENLEYCNELAERVNILADAVLVSAKRLENLERLLNIKYDQDTPPTLEEFLAEHEQPEPL